MIADPGSNTLLAVEEGKFRIGETYFKRKVCQIAVIMVNNTLDERLKLTMELDKPAIRGILFPVPC